MPIQGITNVANAIVNKINNRISSHNSDSNAHQDIRGNIPTIADNLTTDDATKVLSAKQGKVLNDMIGDAIEYINQ